MLSTVKDVTEALLGLCSPCFRGERTGDNSVKFQILTVKTRRGKIVFPLTYLPELEVNVLLDEESGTYSLHGIFFEKEGFSFDYEEFSGVLHTSEWGKYLTHDGVSKVKYNTRPFFDEIQSRLKGFGWDYVR